MNIKKLCLKIIFRVYFELIDKDKNQNLDLDEINGFFKNFSKIKEMNEKFNYLINELEKKPNGTKYFNKDEFIKLMVDFDNLSKNT